MGVSAARLVRARTAVLVAFGVNGVASASFIARTPALRDALGLSTAQLGLLLLCLSGGAVSGLPLAGPLVHRLGAARTVLLGVLAVVVGFALFAAGLVAAVPAPVGVGLGFSGFGIGLWDVAMNVEGADVERRLGRSLMPRLHAAFSIGTVAGAGLGAGAAAAGVGLAMQLAAVATVLPLVMVPAATGFPPVAAAADRVRRGSGVPAAWREPRTLAIGLLVLGFAFTEGAANDWVAVAMVDGYGLGEVGGALGFAVFVTSMTCGRLAGGALLERFGRIPVLRAGAALAVCGLLLVVLGGAAHLAFVGVLLWGLGAALGFPVGMSAAADDPERAAARVAVVSAIGYTAFLAGPPLIGLLAERVGILSALAVVLGALGLALLATPAARVLAPARR